MHISLAILLLDIRLHVCDMILLCSLDNYSSSDPMGCCINLSYYQILGENPPVIFSGFECKAIVSWIISLDVQLSGRL